MELVAIAGFAAIVALMQKQQQQTAVATLAQQLVPIAGATDAGAVTNAAAARSWETPAAGQNQAPVIAASVPTSAWQQPPAAVVAASTLAPAYVAAVTASNVVLQQTPEPPVAASTLALVQPPQTAALVTAAAVPMVASTLAPARQPQTAAAVPMVASTLAPARQPQTAAAVPMVASTLAPSFVTAASAPAAFSEASLRTAGASARFLYTQAEGVSVPTGAVRKELQRYPDHVLFELFESPPMTQRPDFLFQVVLDSDRLASAGTGDVTIAKLMVEEDDPGDPSIFYRGGKLYATQQWNDRTTQDASVAIGGTMEVVYVSDQTSQSAYLRARSATFDTTVGAKCGGVWATGSNDKGKIHVMLHRCVLRAAFMWADAGLGASLARRPCLASI
jgi:hypothetical protein